MNDSNRVAIDNVLNGMRVAFMMAWHPRLGQDSLIRRYIVKDVARLITKQYVTVDRMMIVSDKRQVFRGKEFKHPIIVQEPLQNRQGWKHSKFFFVGTSLILQPIILQLSGLCVMNDRVIETAERSMFVMLDAKHRKLLKSVNKAVERAAPKNQRKEFTRPFKFDDNFETPSVAVKLNEKIMEKVRVFDAKDKSVSVPFEQAFSEGWFDNKPKITMLLEMPHFLIMGKEISYVAKFAREFLVYRNGPPSECLFSDVATDE